MPLPVLPTCWWWCVLHPVVEVVVEQVEQVEVEQVIALHPSA